MVSVIDCPVIVVLRTFLEQILTATSSSRPAAPCRQIGVCKLGVRGKGECDGKWVQRLALQIARFREWRQYVRHWSSLTHINQNLRRSLFSQRPFGCNKLRFVAKMAHLAYEYCKTKRSHENRRVLGEHLKSSSDTSVSGICILLTRRSSVDSINHGCPLRYLLPRLPSFVFIHKHFPSLPLLGQNIPARFICILRAPSYFDTS